MVDSNGGAQRSGQKVRSWYGYLSGHIWYFGLI